MSFLKWYPFMRVEVIELRSCVMCCCLLAVVIVLVVCGSLDHGIHHDTPRNRFYYLCGFLLYSDM